MFSMETKVLEEINKLKDWGLSFLIKAISIPTISPLGDKYEDFKNYAVEKLKEVGLSPKVYEVPKEIVRKSLGDEPAKYPRYIILVRIGSGEIFHINAHYDVVPGGPGWTVTEPFKPKVVNNKVYGRGSSDMKGGLTSSLLSLISLIKFEKYLNFTYEVALVPDEEVGGESGTGFLVKSGISKPKYVIIAEGSGLDSLWIGHKGAVWGQVIVKGKSAHGSIPWLGINAFERGIEVASLFINKLKPRIESKLSKYKYDVEGGNKATIMLGGVTKGGEKINQVPAEFSFTFDRRVIPEERSEDALKEIKEFVESVRKSKGYDIEVKIIHVMDPVVTDPSTDLVIKLRETAKEILNTSPNITVCVGGLDMRYYIISGYKAVTYGPGVLGVAHAPNEYIYYNDVIKAAKIYVLTSLKLFK